MIDVFVVGSLHLDVVVDASRFPGRDETLVGEGVAYRFGGKGGNQALAAARMGARVAMAGRVGDDQFAESVMGELGGSNVDHSQVRQVRGATGMSVAIVDGDGEYGAVVVSGVNQSIDSNEVDIGDAKIVVLQNEIPESVNAAVVRAKHPDSMVVLNAAPYRDIGDSLLRAVDVLVVNRVEAGQMAGNPKTNTDLLETAGALSSSGPGAVVITAGGDGAVVHHGGSADWIRPLARVNGSAHGAGDTFVGTLACELSLGRGLHDAVRFASDSAACFVATDVEKRRGVSRTDVQQWVEGNRN